MRFGPSGNSDSYLNEGFTSTIDSPKWVRERGLDIFEYSFGRGVRIGEAHARAIGDQALNNNIEFSVHAPYYVNFASDKDETIVNSIGYVLKSIEALKWFNGVRCVVHPGSPLKQDRQVAVERMLAGFRSLAEMIEDSGFQDIIICPETMGKINQIGTLEEVLKICQLSKIYIPCIDFGHINSRGQGCLKTKDDYRAIFDKIYSAIGEARGSQIHIHFSQIQYGHAGEIKHLTFEDKEFGPFFEDLAPVLHEYRVHGSLLCESNGTQVEDAMIMKDIYNSFTTSS